MKTVVMLYENGSRSHTIQEEEIFKGSNIQSFIADRAPLDDYGKMVNDAVDYILDDEKAFKAFLKHGRIELSNSAAERMFRHIAMGRRNWLHSGSHAAAQNIAFMYSLYESCKFNDLNFFDYINDVLTRLMKGETDYKSLIPCNYKPVPRIEEEQKEVA